MAPSGWLGLCYAGEPLRSCEGFLGPRTSEVLSLPCWVGREGGAVVRLPARATPSAASTEGRPGLLLQLQCRRTTGGPCKLQILTLDVWGEHETLRHRPSSCCRDFALDPRRVDHFDLVETPFPSCLHSPVCLHWPLSASSQTQFRDVTAFTPHSTCTLALPRPRRAWPAHHGAAWCRAQAETWSSKVPPSPQPVTCLPSGWHLGCCDLTMVFSA